MTLDTAVAILVVRPAALAPVFVYRSGGERYFIFDRSDGY